MADPAILAPPTKVVMDAASMQDIPECCALLEALRKETFWGTTSMRLNWPHIERHLQGILVEPWDRLLLVARDGPLLVGLCYGQIVTQPLIPDWPHLMEWALYVKPAYRKQRIAHALWGMMKRWAKARGAKGCVYGRTVKRTDKRIVEELLWENFYDGYS
mgnify:CR=1 FL=1